MATNIEKDEKRFDNIIKRAIRKNLGQIVNRSDITRKIGNKKISIPIYGLDIPRFTDGKQNQEGVGEGKGNVGDIIKPSDKDGNEPGKAGKDSAEHELEIEVTLDELVEMMGEELELPNIQPKGRKSTVTEKDVYANLRTVGPQGLMNFKHTYFNALKRTISSGEYDPENPHVIIRKEDMRFRSWRTIEMPDSDAVVIYLMDVSGSMGETQKEIARRSSFWIDLWLDKQYKGRVETAYITHDAQAREVDKYTFFHTRESGGTMISSGYQVVDNIIQKRYNPADWNIYLVQYSDGDNWGSDDTNKCFDILKTKILPNVNLMCYGQIESPYGSGEFFNDIIEGLEKEGTLIEFKDIIKYANIEDFEGIMPAIKEFLGTGK